jgi:SAM-dependent methyltransferase
MQYRDLRPALEAYAQGRNVMATLRELAGSSVNDDRIVEIAYDLQAGSYAAYVEANRDYWRDYSAALAAVLARVTKTGDRLLDAGTGELTTLAGVAAAGLPDGIEHFACDLSWSRIRAGRDFVARHAPAAKIESFVGNLMALPLADDAIDVVWTSHALEPNGGREVEMIRELLRVSSRAIVLFEPSYERNSPDGRARMESLGYIRDLPGAAAAAGGKLVDLVEIKPVANALNPTFAHVIEKRVLNPRAASPWACPASRLTMERRADSFFSPASRLSYPIVGGIPVLRAEAAILTTGLE